ncbi:type II toxin-antitoxin system HigB family toxin [Candidatus Nitrotoga arctica]|uniref:Enzyme n=1 Tax=Candidatus Nitrotoga arctica TaxID=453162 RepID=A0ABM8YYT6_9PROT|nr:type II toxin-antitoxin system HigB family toxin [Candidatus Nitrotoga arctica]CAG9932743.1 putative enzyme [Candidatus Nitrotoga arctica]
MRLIGREKIHHLKGAGEQIDKWALNWTSEVMSAHWKLPVDVITQFPKASVKDDVFFIFPVGGNKWTIHVLVAFSQGIALITDLKANY